MGGAAVALHPSISTRHAAVSPSPFFESAMGPGRDMTLRLFPVLDLQRDAVVALFCRPAVDRVESEILAGHDAFLALAPLEWARIDCAILQEALAFSERLKACAIAAVVGASVSFATLGDPRGRMLYREALRGISADGSSIPPIKIEGIPDRAGPGRIREIVESLRPFASRLWVQLPGSYVPAGAHGPLHAGGLVMSMPPGLPQHGMEIEARWLAAQAASQNARACMDRVSTAAELNAVAASGIRFVAGPATGRPSVAPSAPLEQIRAAMMEPRRGAR